MTVTYTYTAAFLVAGVGINGATVNAYKASRFTVPPALNVLPPGGSADATTTTSINAGYNGAFAIALPTSEDYYISVTYAGSTYWQGPVSQVYADGVAEGGTAPAGGILPVTGLINSSGTQLASAGASGLALLGVPTAPTAAALTESTQVATTAYADSAVAAQHTTDTGLYVPLAGGGVVTVPSASPGLTIQFASSSYQTGLIFLDAFGNDIFAIGKTGGIKIFGDRIQAGPSVVGGNFLALDGTTNPPSLLSPGATYGSGARIWFAQSTPTAGWVAGLTQINDLWYDANNGFWYQCTVSGSGTGSGTWTTTFGIGARVAYNAVTGAYTNATASGGTLANAATTSGTAPSIVIPNDGKTYKVELFAPSWTDGTSEQAWVAIYDTTNSATVAVTSAVASTIATPLYVAGYVTGSGQTHTVYSCATTTGHTITIQGGSAAKNTASYLAATRVA